MAKRWIPLNHWLLATKCENAALVIHCTKFNFIIFYSILINLFYWNTGFLKNKNINFVIKHPVDLFFLLTTTSNLPFSSSVDSKAHKINSLVHGFFTFSFYNNMRARVQKLIIYSATLCTTHLHHQVSYQEVYVL